MLAAADGRPADFFEREDGHVAARVRALFARLRDTLALANRRAARDTTQALASVAVTLHAMTLEIQMIARSCGKSDVHHLEPEDMAALTLEASAICGLPLAGTRKVFSL